MLMRASIKHQKILVNMMAGCALIEALTLYVLIFGFVLMGKI